MEDKLIEDERVIAKQMKIESNAYKILMCCLAVSIFYQQFMLNAPKSSFIPEFVCIAIAVIYTLVHSLSEGINIGNSHVHPVKKIVIDIVISVAAFAPLFAILTGERNIKTLALTTLCFAIFICLMRFTLHYLNKRKQSQIDAKLNDEEDGE